MIRALVFDFDGLILDTESPLYASWLEIYREFGMEVAPEAWASLLGMAADPPGPYELLEEHLGHEVDREAIRSRRLAKEVELIASEAPLPGVRELVLEARLAGLLLAVASSSDRQWVEGHLSRHMLLAEFQAVVCADDVRRTKPHPDLYEAALRALVVAPGEAIAFEDSGHGVAAARRAGLFCVAVPNPITRGTDFAHANLVVASLRDLSLSDLVRTAEQYFRPSG